MSKLRIIFFSLMIAGLFISPALAGGFVTNGDFTAGNTGFTSDATYNPVGAFQAGQYRISADPNFENGAYCGVDHTSGTGNMLLIDSQIGAVWSQDINLPADDYVFSAWVTNVVCFQSLPDPTVSLRVNGATVAGPITMVENNATWALLSGNFTVAASGPVTFEVWSHSSVSNGADFGVDDICVDGVVANETITWSTAKALYR